ncbi:MULTISPECIES: mechanosensitive ion channel family protein [Prauserella salsuginis group]|uniref:Small conductance mechanosensitive channel n=2 Tax=Prauserella salsuginis group TaxID=2893672 RepID=A0A839XRJ4_9PSEU|nr:MULTISPECIES: mechanosensitive ion channel domain-containing protein [Prauserella salsuginis group]MBB3664064.1 small conductance mechanosensitive channel [Prauserella sediminis]MCR3721519.1 small conductance mechanosensitive channel [Prauserella flava]MCR3734211.1 small conductance mechanosensitive channel [Prauserella salsuginis]
MPPVKANAFVDWFEENSTEFVSGLINVVIIVVIALVLRAIVGRVIDQLAKRMVNSRERIDKAKAKAASRVIKQNNESRGERQRQRAGTIASVLKSVASFVIFGIAFVTILGQFGINIGPIIASAGVIGLAIGFGAQSLVQDFLSGIFMMVEDQYGVGDVVDVGDAVGTVEAVTLRITKIRDLNGGLWHVRNGEIMRVCNMNQDWANAVVELPLDYSVNLEEAKAVIQRSIDEFADNPEFAPKIIERPDITGVVGIGNGAVTVRVMVMTQPGDQWSIGRDLRGHLKAGLDAAGVRVAYPILPLANAGASQSG